MYTETNSGKLPQFSYRTSSQLIYNLYVKNLYLFVIMFLLRRGIVIYYRLYAHTLIAYIYSDVLLLNGTLFLLSVHLFLLDIFYACTDSSTYTNSL